MRFRNTLTHGNFLMGVRFHLNAKKAEPNKTTSQHSGRRARRQEKADHRRLEDEIEIRVETAP